MATKTGQALNISFCLKANDGTPVDADSTPNAKLRQNGVDQGTTVSVAKASGASSGDGQYVASWTQPTTAKGDIFELLVDYEISSTDYGWSPIWEDYGDIKFVGDLQDIAATDIVSGGPINTFSGGVNAAQFGGQSVQLDANNIPIVDVYYWQNAVVDSLIGNSVPCTVGAYASGQDPGSYVLATPAHKLSTDNSGDVTLTSASVSAIQSGLATSANITSLQSHGDSAWATATGFALASVWTSGLAGTIATNLNATVSSRLAASSYVNPPTTAQIATGVWTDTTGGDFATSGSPGKLLLATGVIVATNNDKTGYALSSTGLDAIATSEPSGTVDDWNFRQRLLALFGRFFNKATAPDSGNGTLTLYQRDGATPLSAQTIADDGTTQTQGGA